MFGFYEREPVVEEDLMRLPHDLQVRPAASERRLPC